MAQSPPASSPQCMCMCVWDSWSCKVSGNILSISRSSSWLLHSLLISSHNSLTWWHISSTAIHLLQKRWLSAQTSWEAPGTRSNPRPAELRPLSEQKFCLEQKFLSFSGRKPNCSWQAEQSLFHGFLAGNQDIYGSWLSFISIKNKDRTIISSGSYSSHSEESLVGMEPWTGFFLQAVFCRKTTLEERKKQPC